MPLPTHVSKTHLIQVIVTGATPTVVEYYSGQAILNTPLYVVVGDRVGFLVQTAMRFGRGTPGYTIGFHDPSFFGVSNLNMPKGGVSEFLQVRSIQSVMKYSVTVGSIGFFLDPEIQSGSDGGLIDRDDLSIYRVHWDVESNAVTYGQAEQDTPAWPLKLSKGDKVIFEASQPGFSVDFSYSPPPPRWGSPFTPNGDPIVTSGASTDRQTATDSVDKNALFKFTFSNQKVTSDAYPITYNS